ncbi:MAG: orotate phosphoribosyltransferase [bacterium]
MNDAEGQALLRNCGALLEGHFLLSSGRHSDAYIEKFRILEQPSLTERLAGEIAQRFRDEKVDIVAGPLTGGVLVAHEVAKALRCHFLFPERVSGKMVLRRGFHVEPGMRVLLVEDVLTTGASIQELMTMLRETGAHIVGAACLVQRGKPRLEIPLFAVIKLFLKSYLPDDCPLCARGVPLEKRGSRQLEKPA